MIISIQFWKEWPAPLRRVFFAIVTLAVIALVFQWFSFFRSPAPGITGKIVQSQELKQLTVHHFTVGIYDLTILGDTYLIFEKLMGNNFVPQPWAAYCFLFLFSCGLVIVLAILSGLSRFWFFVGSGLLIFMITAMGLETLEVFGSQSRLVTITVIMIFVGTGVALQYFCPEWSFYKRLATYAIVVTTGWGLLSFFSMVPQPLHYIAASLVPAGIVLSVAFLVLVAHEIVAALIYVITQSPKSSNSLKHFFMATGIYLLNLWAVYWNDIQWLTWNFTIHPFFIWTVSAVLAVWGIRYQRAQYEGFLDTGTLGVIGMTALACICFATTGFFMASGNDPVLQSLRDLSLYAHLGYGMIFVCYIIANFSSMLSKNLPVFKVLYQPKTMLFFTFRLAGLIATLAFIFYNHWQRPLNDGRGGYYNAIADYYLATKNETLAEGYYKLAAMRGFNNHHSNYVLGNLEEQRANSKKAKQHYIDASERRPTEWSYLRLANAIQWEGNTLETILSLDAAKKDLPNSGAIANAIGLTYVKLDLLDSAYYFFNAAKKSNNSVSAAETNITALLAGSGMGLNVDSLYNTAAEKGMGATINAFALGNIEGIKINGGPIELDDSVLNLYSATYLNNYLLNHLDDADTAFLSQVIEIASKPVNTNYFEALMFTCGITAYSTGQVRRAFQLIQQTAASAFDKGKYFHVLALWALDHDDPVIAQEYLRYFINPAFPPSVLTFAVALTESGQISEAMVVWDSLKKSNDTNIARLAAVTERALVADFGNSFKLTDEEKYLFARYRLKPEDSLQVFRIANSIGHGDLKIKTYFDLAKKLFDRGDMQQSFTVLRKMGELSLSDPALLEEIHMLELLLVAESGDLKLLKNAIERNPVPARCVSERVYFAALMADGAGDSLNAEYNYGFLAVNNPFFVEGVIAASRFFKRKEPNALSSYIILAEALQAHPNSIKLLKAYYLEARDRGFEQYSSSAYTMLEQRLPPETFRKFLRENSP